MPVLSRNRATIILMYAFAIAAWVGVSMVTPTPTALAEEEECIIDSDASQSELEEALERCQEKIEKNTEILEERRSDRESTESDILLINNEINRALLRIQQIDGAIKKLGKEIGDKESTINDLSEQMDEYQSFLQTLLQSINEAEQKGFVSLFFSNLTLSSFFSQTDEYQSLRETVEDYMKTINNLKLRIEANVDDLQEKKVEQGLVRQQQRASASQVQSQKKQKESLLGFQVTLERSALNQLSVYENRAAEIRNRLFDLRGTGAIPFEQALEFAKEAENITGVRPAFLLGLIKNESDLGKNVGTGSHLKDMHPTRDQPIFPYIAKLLGFNNPEELKVSANPGFGWGGAMGPAQFIPSTWVCFGGLVNTRTNSCSKKGDLIKTRNTLQIGSTGSDVKRLQQFLNRQGFTVAKTGAGSPGSESKQYTKKVASAVSNLQERYANIILRPYGYTRGTGIVGPSTRKVINQINFYSGPWEYRRSTDIIREKTRNNRPSNPWNPRDAFFAAATYLQRLGAQRDECTAARRYYAGGNWRSQIASNYCSAVLSNARLFQRDISILEGEG